jgi:hypothetical protein
MFYSVYFTTPLIVVLSYTENPSSAVNGSVEEFCTFKISAFSDWALKFNTYERNA